MGDNKPTLHLVSKPGAGSETEVPMQGASLDIWDKKYRLKTKEGVPVDETIDDTYKRVARALAEVEKPAVREQWQKKFEWALLQGAIPAGRIMSNAGALEHKPATSTINCTVSQTIRDSMDDILGSAHKAGLTLRAGCGIGYEFSTLRPKGAFVSGAGATTSGPLPFMDIYNQVCFTVSSAGGRRGAQMGTFDISHPDIKEFILAKRADGRLRQFNLSCLITDEFMKAVEDDRDWELSFPASANELDDADVKIVYRPWPVVEARYKTREGLVACRVYSTLRARRLWDIIMSSTYDYAEPGFILIDHVNQMNNNWFCETIRATNPCGEQPLPPNGSCLLGSVNLTKFVENPFTDKAAFNWSEYREVIAVFTRMLDNVVEINGLPLEEQRQEIIRKRRHGMGFLGLGSTLAMLKMQYGSPESVQFTDEVTKVMAVEGWWEGVKLAKEKGAAPIFEETFVVTEEMLVKRPDLKGEFKVGQEVKGVELFMRSKYIELVKGALHSSIADEWWKELRNFGCRFTHHTSIAPTGTISLSLANNASNGIEPSFAHKYSRNVIRDGKKTKEKVDVLSYELLAYRALVNPDADPDSEDPQRKLPDYFVNADSLSPRQHVDIQAAAQKWVDSSISKTINVAQDIPFEEFKDVYLYAWHQGLKGCTTFRYNPKNFQGVLVKEEDLENTVYRFELDDGSVVDIKGNEEVEYDGELHSAANLFDALKEGYYGRF